MANLNLPNVREGGDIRFRIGLEDNGVAVDWSGLEGIRVFLYADAQKQVSGECTIEVDAEDNTVLACLYSGDDPQFRGINSVLVRAKYQGEIKVYDKPAINIVARTADADGVLVIDDPVVPVQINVEEVSTSLLNNAIDAAINAAAGAEKAIEDVRDEETAIQAAEAARVLAEQGRVSAEQSRVAQASADHTLAGQDHTRAESDHGTASDDHTLAVSDHGVASGDHTTALVDHSLAESDHTRAESDHGVAGSDHTIAQGDHTQAGSDHSTAVADHTQAGADHTVAGQDHTQAGTDHNTAASDHTQAGLDHTQAGEDHTQALADHQVMAGYDDRLDAVEGEVDQLEAKVTNLRTDVGEKAETRNDVAIERWDIGAGIIADITNENFGKTTSAASFSITPFCDISAYAGGVLHYTRIVTNSTNAKTRSLGIVFYSDQQLSAAISGEVVKYDPNATDDVELTEIQIPANARYVRFTRITATGEQTWQAYVMTEGEYISGLGKRVQDLESAEQETGTTVSELSLRMADAEADIEGNKDNIESLGNTTDDIIFSGISKQEYLYSNFSIAHSETRPAITLDDPVTMSIAGDYVEIKAKMNSAALVLRKNVSSGNIPMIRYASKTQLQIRFSSSANFAPIDSTKINWERVQIIRIVLDSVTGNTYHYSIYIDGVLLGTQEVTGASSWEMVMYYGTTAPNSDLYYIENKNNGIVRRLEKFEELGGAESGATDIYSTIEAPSLSELDERVSALEGGTSYFPLYYTFSTAYDGNHNAKRFYIYVRIKDNIYVRFRLGLYKPGLSDTNVANTYWRLEESALFTISNDTFTQVNGSEITTSGENEFVMRQTSPNKVDYTGGYHGDEFIYDENGDLIEGAFAEFFADGVKIDTSADIPLTGCSSFFYKERSRMVETANSNGATTNVGRPIAWHEKRTEFLPGEGYKTENRLDMIENVPFFAFTGICCISRWISEYAMGESDPLTAMGTGDPEHNYQFNNFGNRLVFYKGNGYSAKVTSEVIFGDDDSMQRCYVYNVTAYNKYYRISQTLTDVSKFKSRMIVTFEKL